MLSTLLLRYLNQSQGEVVKIVSIKLIDGTIGAVATRLSAVRMSRVRFSHGNI